MAAEQSSALLHFPEERWWGENKVEMAAEHGGAARTVRTGAQEENFSRGLIRESSRSAPRRALAEKLVSPVDGLTSMSRSGSSVSRGPPTG